MEKKYDALANDIIRNIGGKENVQRLTHCITRLRFILKDSELPDTEAIKKLDEVLGVVAQGGQYQIIIGNKVDNVYEAVREVLGIEREEKLNVVENEAEKTKDKESGFSLLLKTISTIFTPILSVFTACGILKGLLSLAGALGILSNESGTYIVLYAIANSIFYFLPVILGATAAEHFGISKVLGIVIGGSMIYPTIIAAAGAENFSFLGLPMGVQDYSSTVFPVIVTVYVASKIFKLLKKHVPDVIATFFNPLMTLIIVVPFALLLIGPVTTTLSSMILAVVGAIYNFSPVLCALVLGGPWMILVLLGLHWAFIPLMVEQIATLGYTDIGGLLCSNMFAFAAAMLVVAIKAKDDPQMRSLGISTGLTCLLGVSEPGIFSILLPLKRPLVTAVIASSISAIPAALMGTKGYALGASGIFGPTGNISPNGIDSGFYGAIISALLGFVLGFIITYFFGEKRKSE